MQTGRFRSSVLLALALLFVFIKITWAQDQQSEDTTTPVKIGVTDKGYTVFQYSYNGRWWNTLREDQRGIYIAGLQEGVDTFQVAAGVGSKYYDVRESYFAQGFSPPELASIITDIYKDKSNIRIPISEVLRVTVKKATGLSQDKIEKLLGGLRQKFSNQK
jgi:hypothetical protein